MLHDSKIWIGSCENGNPVYLLPSMANRHGLIAGATGTGKTVSLKVLAEAFSDMGVPVFLSDIKSDLSGMVMNGSASEAIEKRLDKCGVPKDSFRYTSYPTEYWDVYGEQGIPIRATVQDMGPLLMSRMRLNQSFVQCLALESTRASGTSLLTAIRSTYPVERMMVSMRHRAKAQRPG